MLPWSPLLLCSHKKNDNERRRKKPKEQERNKMVEALPHLKDQKKTKSKCKGQIWFTVSNWGIIGFYFEINLH